MMLGRIINNDNPESQTIISGDGRILFYGLNDFIEKIANGDNCFICGADPNSKIFNDEHVIPDWILRKFDLHSQTITLPNGTTIQYGKYTVPCCEDCNSSLGDEFEKPISQLFSKSYQEIVEVLQSDKEVLHKIFRWISLIFLKTHLKDKFLRNNRDLRVDSGPISERYEWEDLHHIHCIARSFHSGSIIDENVYGSIAVLPIFKLPEDSGFDYGDNPTGKGVFLQLNEVCILCVLDDAKAALGYFSEYLQKITGALSPFQAREILAHFNFINIHLKERPVFTSNFDLKSKEYIISVKEPEEYELVAEKDWIVTHGKFLRHYVKDMIGAIPEKEKYLNEIEQGKRSYLLDNNGEFIRYEIPPTNDDGA